MVKIDADALCQTFFDTTTALMRRILVEEKEAVASAAARVADQIAADRLVYVFGPGGHSNIAAHEIYFRAGGLMHISAILDAGTLISNGCFRSMAMERLPGYGKIVIADRRLGKDDLLILVNAYGINAALIDAALEAKRRGVLLIGVSSHRHAESTAPEHPARHPTKHNLHDLVDIAIDCKIPIGDAVIEVPGLDNPIAPISTFANSFALNCLVIQTVVELMNRGIEPPIWKSANAPGGDEANALFIDRFRDRIGNL